MTFRGLLIVLLALAMPAAAFAQAVTPAPATAPRAAAPAPGESAATAAANAPGPALPTPPPLPTLGAPAVAPPSSGDRAYLLGAGDIVDVSILGRPEFNTRARVGSDGAILLPLLGATSASNRSPGQLADDIRAALEKGGFYSQPSVRVEVSGVASRYVTILGAVASPGLLPLDRQYHLSEIVARFGGRGNTGADYLVLTHQDGKSQQYKLADLGTATGDSDPVLQTGDKIYVPAAENSVFYITGQVKNPGSFQVSENLTVRMAIAKAGGLAEMGSEKKVSIHRDGKDIKVPNLDEMKLKVGDIVNVGEKLF